MTTRECVEFDASVGPVPQQFSEKVHTDDRGYFTELFNQSRIPVPESIAQINHSHSTAGVLRGMHWQVSPFAVGKYVTCLRGVILDAVVDLRRSSSTFCRWRTYSLLGDGFSEVRHSLWVPEGFAHGFLTFSAEADVVYLQSGLYCPAAERSLRFDDPTVGINWFSKDAVKQFVVSAKDRAAPLFTELMNEDLFA
jgi:dTDP-4-dehydrorhamnose 3,5-epimerase